MNWVRELLWFAGVGLAVVIALYLVPGGANRNRVDLNRPIEDVRAEFEEKRAQRSEKLDKIQSDGTLETLRSIGRAYRRHIAQVKTPPTEADFRELTAVWHGRRDGKPFVIQWGVDLGAVANPTGTLLAWESTPDAKGQRCVLLADAETAKLVPETEFEKLPRAK